MALLLTSHCDMILSRGAPDQESRQRLDALKRLDLDMFLADVARTPPDAVIVEEGWAAKHFHDPKATAWLAGYRRTAGVGFVRDDAPIRSPSTHVRRRRPDGGGRRFFAGTSHELFNFRRSAPGSPTSGADRRPPRGGAAENCRASG